MANVVTDHQEIRKWAEQHGGKPAAVDRTHQGDDVGIIRIMFPKAPHSEHAHLVEISWDEFFKEFEERKLALLYDPKSLFSKIIGRDTAERREEGDNGAARRNASGDQGKADQGDGRSGERHSLKEREYRDSDGDILGSLTCRRPRLSAASISAGPTRRERFRALLIAAGH
jgi:hypothetical protein